jgi:AcrR family transcriptional regulator
VNSSRQRANPLPPEERRQSILEAVTPLLLEKGASVTTSDIARAAGIAEGTIFAVFPDKATLIMEAVKSSVDPEPVRKALREIDRDAPLEAQLRAAAHILMLRYERISSLIELLRAYGHSPEHQTDARRHMMASNVAISEALTDLLETHRDQFRIEPSRVVAAFRGLMFAAGHPLMYEHDRLSIDEVVELLMNGARLRSEVTA